MQQFFDKMFLYIMTEFMPNLMFKSSYLLFKGYIMYVLSFFNISL